LALPQLLLPVVSSGVIDAAAVATLASDVVTQ
jgi:hypothetical protein